jgi:hypothetical protein
MQHNGVQHSSLRSHLAFNVHLRSESAMFVDGVCVHEGTLPKWEIKMARIRLIQLLSINPITRDTFPYV